MTAAPGHYNGQPPNRLDQIEAILFQTVTSLNQVTQRIDRVAEQQEVNTQAIAGLTLKIDNLTADIASLTDITMHSIQNAEDDREAWQSEIRRIWEYLRDRNGGSAVA